MEFVERSTGLKSDVQLINGGLWTMQNDFVASHPFSPDDYDKTSPLEQWKSQHPLGLQVIAQLESKNLLSKDAVRHSLDKAIAFLHESSPVWGSQKTKIQQCDDVGDGLVLVATWLEGTIIVLWDGREHVDVNMFAYDGLESQVEHFQKRFQMGTSLSTVLYDEHPRGFGRVVSYKHDFDPEVEPHWA